MKINEKVPQLKRAIEFVSRHDDAPIAAVEKILADAVGHIKSELVSARKRRATAKSKS